MDQPVIWKWDVGCRLMEDGGWKMEVQREKEKLLTSNF